MKKIKLIATMMSFASLFTITSCTNKESQLNITLNEDKIVLNTNDAFDLKAKEGDLIINDSAVWTSSNEKVVTVNNGELKAVGAGTATITCEYNGKTEECEVEVKAKPVICVSEEHVRLEVGNTHEISLLYKSKEITEGVKYVSVNEDIATVENGVISAVKSGETVIEMIYEGKTYKTTVQVMNEFVPVGNFYGSFTVKAMGTVTFEFDLKIKEDKTYTFSRRKANIIMKGENLGEGSWTYDCFELILNNDIGDNLKFSVIDEDNIESVGEIYVGHGKTRELSLTRVTKK